MANSPRTVIRESLKLIYSTLYRYLFSSREIDKRERLFVAQNLAHFHVSGAGHEASAAIARHLKGVDWLHLHYRDKALLLARGVPISEFFRSLLSRGSSHSAGRQMSAHFSAPHLNVTSLVGPVGNNALHAVGVAAAIKRHPGNPIVICSVGDGTTQQGEFMEAVAEAVRWQLPVLFLVEDNRWSISTPTRGKTLFHLPHGPAHEFLGLTIHRFDGSDVVSFDRQVGQLIPTIRELRQPHLMVLEVERLDHHTNTDDQTVYRDDVEIRHGLTQCDPVENLRNYLLQTGTSEVELKKLELDVTQNVLLSAELASSESNPIAVFTAKAPYSSQLLNRTEYCGDQSLPQLNMREALGAVLRNRLTTDPRVILYGQDIEDPKGDVFGVTRGLSTTFPNRVINAPLSESTIVGTAIGRALAGQRPVAFIQFADFLPLAFNQIVSELGSMYWRTNGGWQCPVILMVTCGGYKPGLGPFHAQTMDGFAAHVPGIDVVMPSSAADAAGLLNAAFESPRPTIFLYPKSCLNLSDRTTSADIAKQFVPIGRPRKLRSGRDLTLVTWGNPIAQCVEASNVLVENAFTVDLFDLRSLSPWEHGVILASVERTGRLVVVHEDNQTCGFGAEVLAIVGERAKRPVQMRRIARPDTYIPCSFGNQLEILPSFKHVLETCADLLQCDVTWQPSPSEDPGEAIVRAVSSGPADESVVIVNIDVKVGDSVNAGQVVAEIEATKSVADVCATVGGIVTEIFANTGDTLRSNEPLIRLKLAMAGSQLRPPQIIPDDPGVPQLSRRLPGYLISPALLEGASRVSTVEIVDIVGVTGAREVSNHELAENWPSRSADEIFRLTGIETRRWIDTIKGETVLSLAVRCAHQLLSKNRLSIDDIDLVIACTTTPDITTPSLAFRIVAELTLKGERPTVAAYDINAACSGYLYALAQAFDYLQQQPASRVLIITSEVLSQLLDLQDFDTSILFGDAATATLVVGNGQYPYRFRLTRPVISGTPDTEMSLSVPLQGAGFVRMDGGKVFRQAVRSMAQVLCRACQVAHIAIDDLELLVPHQANQRILDALQERIGRPVLSALRHTGNTSSSSIPLALQNVSNGQIAMISFGGGFTFAATIASCIGPEENSVEAAHHRDEVRNNHSDRTPHSST